MEYQYDEANYIRIVLAGLVDAAIALSTAIYFLSPFPVVMIFILYRLVSIYFFDSTVGMRIFNLIYLDADKEPLSAREKFSAAFLVLYQGVDYYSKRQKIS